MNHNPCPHCQRTEAPAWGYNAETRQVNLWCPGCGCRTCYGKDKKSALVDWNEGRVYKCRCGTSRSIARSRSLDRIADAIRLIKREQKFLKARFGTDPWEIERQQEELRRITNHLEELEILLVGLGSMYAMMD